jgi:hypothetical protein
LFSRALGSQIFRQPKTKKIKKICKFLVHRFSVTNKKNISAKFTNALLSKGGVCVFKEGD